MIFLRRLFARKAATVPASPTPPTRTVNKEPPGDGWQQWLLWNGRTSEVYEHPLIEMWRAEWGDETEFGNPRDLNEAMNVIGLYWRKA